MAVELEDAVSEAVEHVVEFYERESDLAETVGQYLVAGVKAGDIAIVVASEAHLRAFKAELAAAGIDLAAELRRGRVVALDAAATLARFADDGRIDRDAFNRLVGALVRETAAQGHRIRAYGEMVAILWEAGHVVAAIELESLWNDLQREVPFSLLCAYPAEAISAPGHADALQEICCLHTSVRGRSDHARRNSAHTIVGEFPSDPSSPHAARQLAVDALRDWGHDETIVHNVALVLTELVTNAIVHARSAVSVSVHAKPSVVRIAVQDQVSAVPIVRDPGLLDESGRGLRLVAALANRWGVDVTSHGSKVVWAEIST